uniref:MobD protein n=1 Tax=Vibrio anguillarum serovar O2 TaxID=105260 RepID=A4Q8I5_VIBAN|nr:mobD protein [Vibrio anguillarum serovar O2]
MTAKKTPTPQSKRLLELEQIMKQRTQQSDQILQQNQVSLEVVWEAFCELQFIVQTLSEESSKQSKTISEQSKIISELSKANSTLATDLRQETESREQLQTTMTSLTQSVDTLIAYLEKQTR